MNIRDLAERILWTAVQAAGATLMAAATIDGVEVWHAAAIAGLSGAMAALTTYARTRLGQLEV